jgi:hypothetical protein
LKSAIAAKSDQDLPIEVGEKQNAWREHDLNPPGAELPCWLFN